MYPDHNYSGGTNVVTVKQVEATAPDGLIEAVSLNSSHPFFLAVQWHPEWKVGENPFYLSMFEAFRRACSDRAQHRKTL